MENKIEEKELTTIREQQQKVEEIINRVGYVEAEKHALLHELGETNRAINETKKSLEEKYGAIEINMTDGSYTEIEQEETPVAAV